QTSNSYQRPERQADGVPDPGSARGVGRRRRGSPGGPKPRALRRPNERDAACPQEREVGHPVAVSEEPVPSPRRPSYGARRGRTVLRAPGRAEGRHARTAAEQCLPGPTEGEPEGTHPIGGQARGTP